jgi:hypothetical protein
MARQVNWASMVKNVVIKRLGGGAVNATNTALWCEVDKLADDERAVHVCSG